MEEKEELFEKSMNLIEKELTRLYNEKTPQYVYVIMHCGEHVDYVEKVFLDEDKANSYCEKYDELDNQYRRYVYKIEITL